MSVSMSLLNSDDNEWVTGRLIAELQRLNNRLSEIEAAALDAGLNLKDLPNPPLARRNIGIPDGSADAPLLTWENGSWGTGNITVPESIDDLSDVSITSVATGQVLEYDGTNWVNVTVASILPNLAGDVTGPFNATVIPNDSITFDKLAKPAVGIASLFNGSVIDSKIVDMNYSKLFNVPTEFPPEAHTHDADDIVSGEFPTARYAALSVTDAKIADVAWSKITGKPTEFPPESHTHDAGDVISGEFPTVRIENAAITSPKLANTALKPIGEVWGKNVAGDWTVEIPGNMLRGDGTLYPTALSFECDTDGGLDVSVLRNTRVDAPGAKNPDDIEVLYVIRDGGVSTAKIADGAITNAKVTDVDWSKVTSKPTSFPPESHTHDAGDIVSGEFPTARYAALSVTNAKIADVAWSKLTGVPAFATRWPAWSEVTSKPASFPPTAHTHAAGDIVSGEFPTARYADLSVTNAKIADVDWLKVTDKPTEFPPESHTHDADDVISGEFPTARYADLSVTDAKIADVAWSKLTSVPDFATRWPEWSEVTSKPTSFTPEDHNLISSTHPDVDIGTLAENDALVYDGTSKWENKPIITVESGYWVVEDNTAGMFDTDIIFAGGTPASPAAAANSKGIGWLYSATRFTGWVIDSGKLILRDGTFGGGGTGTEPIEYTPSAADADRKLNLDVPLDLKGTAPTEGQVIVADEDGKPEWGLQKGQLVLCHSRSASTVGVTEMLNGAEILFGSSAESGNGWVPPQNGRYLIETYFSGWAMSSLSMSSSPPTAGFNIRTSTSGLYSNGIQYPRETGIVSSAGSPNGTFLERITLSFHRASTFTLFTGSSSVRVQLELTSGVISGRAYVKITYLRP